MKKVLVFVLSVLLVLSLTACGGDKSDKTATKSTTPITGTAPIVDSDAPTFTVDSATAKVGETFTVAVRTKNNPGIIALKLALEYDADVLELLEATEQDFAGVTYGPIEKDPFVISWVDAIHPDNSTDGVISTLTFRVRDGAPLGDTKLALSYDPEDVFNAAWENVTFNTQTALVTVEG